MKHENLERLADIVEDKLAAADAVIGDMAGDYDAWSKRRREAEAALVEHFTSEHDARFTETRDASVRMAGIRSSSTMGVSAALRNWRTAARLKLAQLSTDPINLQGSGPAPIEPREL